MFGVFNRILLIVLPALGLTVFGTNQVHAQAGLPVVNEYLDLVASGNYESAEQYWTEESRQRASRFGIEYIDIPLKIDCASPIVRNPGLGVDMLPNPVGIETALGVDDYYRYSFQILAGMEKLKQNLYARGIGRYVWLIFPQEYHTLGWPARQTKYFDIHYQPAMEKYLNPVVLDEADRFVETMAKKFGISQKDLELLEKEKIRYIYCESDRVVNDITGYLTKGTYDLASDDIISAFFPHYHELTHFLVNFRLRRLPLYTLPVFREGTAVLFGGRWGKAPRSMLTLGGYLYKEGVVWLDSLLTMSDFEKNAMSDLGYPVAALFVSYLMDKKGVDNFFALYQQMSGSFDRVNSLTMADIQTAVTAQMKLASWEELTKEFDQYVLTWLSENCGVYPGTTQKGDEILSSGNIVVTRDGDWVNVTATYPAGQTPTANILFGLDSALNIESSMLFEEHYRGQADFAGYRYGVRFDQFEAGVYDYATSHILAKYIWGMAPSADFYNQEVNRVTLRFNVNIVDGQLPSPRNFVILDQ